jgi:hypothetical protein
MAEDEVEDEVEDEEGLHFRRIRSMVCLAVKWVLYDWRVLYILLCWDVFTTL